MGDPNQYNKLLTKIKKATNLNHFKTMLKPIDFEKLMTTKIF